MSEASTRRKRGDRPGWLGRLSIWALPAWTYLLAVCLFVVGIAAWMFVRAGFIGPEVILVGLLLVALLLGRVIRFLRDWLPFVVILFGWQMLRGYADNAAQGGGFPLRITEMIHWDEWLFGGHIPAIWLQDHLYTPGHLHWYDLATTFFWAFHFVLPLMFGFLLWMRDRRIYLRFALCVVVVSFAGFATYVLFPAAPPWYASDAGYIPPVHLIRAEVLGHLGADSRRNLSWLMSHGSPDNVAAMPSLHAAYPTMVFWFALRYWRKLTPLAVMYCLGLWFSVVYIGDHYVVDVLAGVIYATSTFFLVHFVFRLLARVLRDPAA